jgi:hypothetical protein
VEPFRPAPPDQPIGYQIEGVSDRRSLVSGTPPAGQISRIENKFGGKLDGKMGGKGVVHPPSMPPSSKGMDAFPGKATEVPPSAPETSSSQTQEPSTSPNGETQPPPTIAESQGTQSSSAPSGSGGLRERITGTPDTGAGGTSESSGTGTDQTGNESSSPETQAPESVTDAESEQQASGPDIDRMAREIYSILRDRLRIEQERRTSR